MSVERAPNAEDTAMPRRPQQQTLSVRISDDVRLRLERTKDLIASQTGTRVSTSEVAKRFLESAREDRLEVVELLAKPTETLLHIRRKGEAQYLLSRAEWAVLAHFVQRGVETFSTKTPNPVSRDSLLTVLDAFLAVYELGRDQASASSAVYVGNLPSECRPANVRRVRRSDQKMSADVVRRTVLETRRRLNEGTMHAGAGAPVLAGRNLSVLLEDEPLIDCDAINRALRPYWPVLWRLAARGHYALTQKPVRNPPGIRSSPVPLVIPPITERNYTLSFDGDQDHEFCWLLSLPGAKGPRYPIWGYQAITEFCAMVRALASEGPHCVWRGGYFFGYVADSHDDASVWFRAHNNGVTLGFSADDWQAVRLLVNRAWDLPDLRTAWDALALEYGEL